MKNNKRSLKFFENRRKCFSHPEYRPSVQIVFCPVCGCECIRKSGDLFLTEVKSEKRGFVTQTWHEDHKCKKK